MISEIPQREFRDCLSQAYCWSSPNNVEDDYLILTILKGLITDDILLAISYYGEARVQAVLDSAIDNDDIPHIIQNHLNLKWLVCKEILHELG